MAIADYTTDLATINLSTGSWSEPTGAADGRLEDQDGDNYIAGSNCESSQTRSANSQCGMVAPANAVTIPSGSAAFFWFYHGAMPTIGNITDTIPGYAAIIGSATSAYKWWAVAGKDTLPKGGWFSVAVDPLITPTETNVGSPTTTTSIFGSRIQQDVAVSKGNPYCNDYIRYGRSLIVTAGDSGTPAVFQDAADENDLQANKWGLFENLGGGFSQKGLFQMGSAGTAVYFDDSNATITIEDTLHVNASFNEFEVLNASSTILWTSISISKSGLVGLGLFTVTDNATVTKVGCTFTDMGLFTYQSNSTLTGCTYRRCGIVTLGGGTFTNCLFTNATGTTATIATALSHLVGCTFESSGTGYAVDLSATTISTDTTMSWTNTSSGYTDTSGNRTLKVTVDGTATLTINNDTGDTLFYENAGTSTAGANGDGVVIVTGQRTITFNISPTPTDYEYRIYTVTALGSLAGASEVQGAESNSASSQAYTYSYAANTYIALQILDHTDVYRESINYYELADANSTQNITLEEDTND